MALTEEVLKTLDDVSWFVLFVFAYSDTATDAVHLHKNWLTCKEPPRPVAEFCSACQRLTRDGLLTCQYAYRHRPADSRYSIAPGFDDRVLRALQHRSIERGWWHLFGVDSQTGLPLPEQAKLRSWNYDALQYAQKEAIALRMLVDAAGLCVDYGSFYDPASQQWRSSCQLVGLLRPSVCWPWPTAPFGPTNPLKLHLRLLSVLFAEGRDVRPFLTGLAQDVAAGRLRLSESEVCEVVALSVLAGVSADWSHVAKWGLVPEAAAFAGLAETLRGNDLVAANKLCLAAFKAVPALGELESPAFNLLAALVSAFAKPAAARVLQHLRALCPSTTYRYNERSSGEREIVTARAKKMTHVQEMTSGLMEPDWKKVASDEFLGNLAFPLEVLVSGAKKETVLDVAEAMLASAGAALRGGYPTLAGVYLAAFGWAIPAARREEAGALAAKITEAGGIWLRPFDTASSEWKRVLAALDERLPKKTTAKAATAGRVKTGRLVWALAIDSANWQINAGLVKSDRAGNLVCDRLVPYFRGPRAAEDGSDDKAVTLKSVYGGKYDDCLSEADKTVVAALNKAGYSGPHGQASVPAAVLEALCGQDNVVSYEGDAYMKNFTPVATTLVRQDVPIVGTSLEGGAIRLTVPPWCLGVTRTYVIRKTDEQAYAFYPLGRDVRSILEVFGDFGDKGAIMFPKEALTSAKTVFGRLAAVLPLQGALADVAGGDGAGGMTRMTGETVPLVRLSLEEMRLHVSLRVRPIPAAATVLFEPGVGQAERTLKLAKGPVILVRDLAAEKKQSAAVEKALADFDGDRDGACEWQFDEPASALEALAALHALGEAVRVEWLPGQKVAVARPAARPNIDASLGADEWFAVSGDWKLDDGRLVSFAKLLENYDRRVGRFVPIDEKGYLALSRALLRQLEALRAAGQVRKNEVVVSPAALPMLDGAFAAEGTDALALPKAMSVAAARIREVFASTPAAPADFKGTMRPYQEEGYQWLARLCACGIGCCLADDMGLGKTVQLIALLAAQRTEGPSLVIAPASVAFNWRNELSRFAPSLKVALVGQTAGADDADVAGLAKGHDVVVTSYGVASSRLASFAAVTWNILILDEAQAIKNHLTQRAKSVKELKARFRVAATGTPVENRLTELWSIFDFLNPGMLGGEARFAKELAPHGEATPRLKRLVKPLILRRIKRDVLTDLPEKEEITVPVVLGDEERHAYEATRLSALAKLEDGDRENKIAILAELTRLRRFCCHPSLVLPTLQEGAKLEALERLLAGLRENGHRALVFSQFVDFLALVRGMLERRGWSYRYLDGATPKQERERSVEAFQNGEGDFFLISLKAGGMGLNLTAANYVILLDPWWNPAVENQAADRVHRIGQRLPVTVYRLIAQDTIEEKVVNLHAKKTALAEDILASGASALSAEDMLGLLGESSNG